MCDCECVIIAGQLSTTPTQQPIDLNPDVAYEEVPGPTHYTVPCCQYLGKTMKLTVSTKMEMKALQKFPVKHILTQLRCMVRYRGEVQVAASYSASVYYCTIVQVLVSTYMWQTMHLHPFGCMTGNHCCMHSSAIHVGYSCIYFLLLKQVTK